MSVINKFNYSTQFSYLGQWTSISLANSTLQIIFPNTFTGWDNKTLHICTTQVKPAITLLGNNSYYELHQTFGLINEILQYLSANLNFSVLLYEAADKQFGARIGNTTKFTGCVEEVLQGRSLFAASVFTFTYSRQEFIDFSYPIMEESNVPLLRKPEAPTKMWHVFRPLHWVVWLLTVITIFITSIICFAFSKWNPLSAWNLELPFSIIDEIKITENCWNTIGAFLMQGQDFYPYTMSSRSALAVWWLFSLIIFSAYTADLTSFLTINDGNNQLKSLNELAESTEFGILVPSGSNLDSLLDVSTNPIYMKLNGRKVSIDSINSCAEKILETSSSNLACISDTSAINYFVNEYCTIVYTIPETFNTAPLGFLTPKEAPYKEIMDTLIQKMVETGIMSRWIDIYWKKAGANAKQCNTNSDSATADSINLDGVLGIYIITWGLLIAATIILGAECLYKRVSSKRNQI